MVTVMQEVEMSDSDSPRKFGCLAMFRRRSNSTSKKRKQDQSVVHSISMQTLDRSRSSESLSSVTSADISFANLNGVLDSFAKMITADKYRKRHSSAMRTEKLIMLPYFGHFAGQRLHFDLKRTAEYSVSIKVRTDDQIVASLHHRQGRKKETVRDQCIKFAHEATTPFITHQPPTLSFLSEQTVNLFLNDLPYKHLPPRYRSQFLGCYQLVKIQVHPHQIHPEMIEMKLRPRISIREFQWMLSKRLDLNNPSAMMLYVKDSLEPLPATSPLEQHHSEVVCIIAPSAQQLKPSVDPGLDPISLCVSIIGKGVEEVIVYQNTTLYEFEQAIKKKFCLRPDSFLYLPDVLSNHNRASTAHCPLRMHAVLDSGTSTILLLDHEKRNFPTLYGHFSVSEQQTLQSLLLYKMTVSELDLLKSGPVIGFEVTGPTIPIALKTMNDLTSDPACFSVISIRPHAVSINPEWNVEVLLKFLTCISGFPCSQMKIGEKVLTKTVSSEILDRPWFIVEGNGYILPNKIPSAYAS